MNFGKLEDISGIDFSLPQDHPFTSKNLKKKKTKEISVYVGAARWSRSELKGLYPRGTKDELSYYATQFNSIELNATFYSMPSAEQIHIWRSKTPSDFKFFPKITSSISHYRRLINVVDKVTDFAMAVMNFEEQLGMIFMQLHDNFKPKDYDRLEKFVKDWPQELPLAIELRNEEWFSNKSVNAKVFQLFEENNITAILVDTPGRRDVLHMHLTTSTAFIRYVSANDEVDIQRLDSWVERATQWKQQGLENLYFFVHQKVDKETPMLSAYLIESINKKWNTNYNVPKLANP